MKPDAPLSVQSNSPPPVAAKAPPTAFGKGFVTDAWYFVALGRDVAPGSLKRHEIMGEPVLILAFVVFDERPDGLTLTGAAIIVASGCYMMWRETVLRRRPSKGAGLAPAE